MLRWLIVGGLVVLSGCGSLTSSDDGAVVIPLHESSTQGDGAPTALTVTRLDGPDGPTIGDTWTLMAQASDPSDGPVVYGWKVTSGRLSSDTGAKVTWTATEATGRVEFGVSATGAGGASTTASLAARVTAQAASGPIVDDYDTIGYFCSVALDGDDNPHITFRDDTHPSLYYARWTGDSWDVELVEGYGLGVGGDTGYHTSVAVDDAGNAHAAWFAYYLDDDGEEVRTLVYGARSEGGWTLAPLTAINHSAAFPVKLLLNPATNQPEILYQRSDEAAVMLATCSSGCTEPGQWQFDVVYEESRSSIDNSSFDVAYPGGFAFQDDGTRHVTVGYEYRESDALAGLLYLSNSGGSWSAPETVSVQNDDSFQDIHGARLRMDALGRPVALTQFGVWQRLGSNNWRQSLYDDGIGNHIFRFDLAVDTDDTALAGGKLFFTLPSSTVLELVETDDRGYFEFTYMGSITSSARARTSLVVDSAGDPHMCWSANGDLQYR